MDRSQVTTRHAGLQLHLCLKGCRGAHLLGDLRGHGWLEKRNEGEEQKHEDDNLLMFTQDLERWLEVL